MKYELIYLSQSGNTEKLFYGIASQFQKESHLVNLNEMSPTDQADIYIIGFGINSGTIPLKIMDALDDIHDKDVGLIITCGFEATEEYKKTIERKISPFLNENCKYHGMLLCQGEFSEPVLKIAEEKLLADPNHPYAAKMLHDTKISAGHPDQQDIQNAIDFITKCSSNAH